MTKNMTEGKTLPLLFQFALPLLIGNLLQQTYNLMDAIIVGKILGNDALGAVNASSSVQFFVLGFCIGVACGFGIPIAQRFGADDLKGVRECVFHGAVLTGVTAVILTIACAVFCPQILHLLKVTDTLFEDAYDYLFVIFLGIPFTLLYNLLSSILRAVGDSRTPFIFLAISTVLNIGLDFLFILVLQMGCTGAALATIASQGVSGILCFFYINRKVPMLHLKHEDYVWNGHTAKMMIVMGVPMGLQYSITAIGSMVMQAANNNLGDLYISAFAAACKLRQLAMCPFDAIATAASTFAGQNLGAGKMNRIRKGVREGVLIDAAYGLLAGVILFFFGKQMTTMFVSTSEESAAQILELAGQNLKCAGIFFWSLGFLNSSRMIIQGIGFAGRAMFSGLIEMVIRITVSIVLVPIFGFNGITIGDPMAWVGAACYVVPMLIYCLKCSERKLQAIRMTTQPRIEEE